MWTLLLNSSVAPLSFLGLAIVSNMYGLTALTILFGALSVFSIGFAILTFGMLFLLSRG